MARKTLRLGPLRLNLYASGASLSVGAGPARVVHKLLGKEMGKTTLYAFGTPLRSMRPGQAAAQADAVPDPTLEEMLRYTRLELDEEERRLERNPRLYAQHRREHEALYDTLATLPRPAALAYLEAWWEGHRVYRGPATRRKALDAD